LQVLSSFLYQGHRVKVKVTETKIVSCSGTKFFYNSLFVCPSFT